ncbi:AGC family protein kinase [Trichomonas vaginalis G3]|uniref:non-specific serine/threonine protein kinase n=1 Tax=Trichomonas vaginalis (strain ATCC PRA-98 / G3) TaxID=412133 RepID=A2E1S0_TRIV3|nr:STKc Nek domain-containing protein [Trichomonas vaginalis G3]EAY13399.1 AGC family protein kinase [Trichomonas vaginalis G3]KAI5528151.1 STKc Nek domain-containing protein [Trichomonas vaginalis G3]|eukprot:XP_001325622.1 AGC family protein kinase [Trichomonas vaginalis G3]
MDQFKIVKEIGRGGYGRALLVRSLNSNDLKVVKAMNLTGMTQEAKDTAFREVEILSTLKHTNIIRYRGCTKQKRNLYILMDYADGGDLSQAIKRQGVVFFSEDQILDWFVQICLAMKYLHDRKILHRDMKPQNVFLSSGNIVKLGDFGIAKTLEHTGDMAKTSIGTPLYCSPEICVGKKYNTKSDIWSLGCVLYELASLKRPFTGRNVAEIMRNVIGKTPKPIPAQYSTELQSLVESMLRKNPDERPSINEIFQMPLIRNKAIALLGKTLAGEELNHGVFHGEKPGKTPDQFIENVEYNLNAEPASKNKAGIYKVMKKMAENLQMVIKGDNLIDVPEEVEDMSLGDFYFMGRKLIIKSVHVNDSLGYKVESIRVFLEDLLGIEKFKQIYDTASDEKNTLGALELSKSDAYVFQLIMQLVAYEKTMDKNNSEKPKHA